MFRTQCKEHDHSAFYNFLNMEQNHKNNDCYFFYYSTCAKGDSCAFRHEPSALGCEVMCSYWQQGNCLNEKCNFRHMELKKNRKSIPCYWESQRGGCKKPHCPFMHTQPRPTSDTPATKTTELPTKPVSQEWSNRPDDGKFDGSGTESDQGRGSSEAGSFIGSPAVDSLIVNFDEGTLSLPSSLQTNLNLRTSALGMRNRMTMPIDIDMPNRLAIGNNVTSGMNVTQTSVTGVQGIQHHHHHQQQQSAIAAAAVCHHAARHPYNQTYHSHTPGQTLQLHNQPTTSIPRRNYPPLSGTQNPRARCIQFPFGGGFPSYRRY